jgi:glycerol-3-phosphate dehydrogenase
MAQISIVGGGINGVGIAWQAAMAGFSVDVFEQASDLAAGTSGKSSKLIHGGLRYLRYGELRLVQESLEERHYLLENFPELVHPLEFRIPTGAPGWGNWRVGAGLKLYQWLARHGPLPAPDTLKQNDCSLDLQNRWQEGWRYWDAATDDVALVQSIAEKARAAGAHFHLNAPVQTARAEGGLWHISTPQGVLSSPILINAAGPWAASLFGSVLPGTTPVNLRLVQGSHLVVPRILHGDYAYALPQADERLVFILPWKESFNLIGTTDVEVDNPSQNPKVQDHEVDYLLDATNRYLARPLRPQDIVEQWAGIRALPAAKTNATRLSRDYQLHRQDEPGGAILINVFGGKLTTFRALALAVLRLLQGHQ